MAYGTGLQPGVFNLARPVVVGYNGKKHSQRALAWAAAEAARRHADLVVLYAANYPGMVVDPGPGLFQVEPGALDAAEEVTTRGVNEAVAAHPRLQVMGATEVTSPTRALVEAGADAELLVIGTRGFNPTTGALLGSVAFAVAARATCPVIVVKGDPADAAVPTRPVVVGTDGSDQAAAAVRFAAERAATESAALKIVTCTGGQERPHADPHELTAAASEIALTAAADVRRAHPDLVVATQVEDCLPERALVDDSAEAGLVVVGTRGRGAFQGWLLGSVSHAVISGAQCPVAVITDVER